MTHQPRPRPPTHRPFQLGQSLVEVAVFLPILLVLVAGVVEVSHLVITQNRVSTAARIAARFAASGGEDEGMWIVALRSVTQTLEINEEEWDIWSIRATVGVTGGAFATWDFRHIYGISNTVDFGGISETVVMQDAINQLRVNEEGGDVQLDQIADLQVVGALVLHDVHSILGLDAIPDLVGFSTIRGLNVMRRVGLANLEPTSGCDAFPVAVEEGLRSITGPPGVGSNPYPEETAPNGFDSPSNPPAYWEFIHHQDDVPLLQAREGYLYKIRRGLTSATYGWLNWNVAQPPDAASLEVALAWPGASRDYRPIPGDGVPGSPFPGSPFPHRVRGFIEVDDPTDISLHIGDRAAVNGGAVDTELVRDVLNDHVDGLRQLRLIVWRNEGGGSGNSGGTDWLRITRFAVFRLRGYKISADGDGPWILAEFIRWDDTCGQVVDSP